MTALASCWSVGKIAPAVNKTLNQQTVNLQRECNNRHENLFSNATYHFITSLLHETSMLGPIAIKIFDDNSFVGMCLLPRAFFKGVHVSLRKSAICLAGLASVRSTQAASVAYTRFNGCTVVSDPDHS